MKRFLILLVAAGLILSAGPASAAEKLTVLLDWFVNPDHGPLFVALERGEFAKRGLEVEFISPADPNDPPKLVAAGRADVAVSYQPQLHLQVEAGLPLTRIGTLIATPLNSVVVLADSPIRSIADLKGRKIGFSVGGFEDALLGAMLAKHGLSLDDVELSTVYRLLDPLTPEQREIVLLRVVSDLSFREIAEAIEKRTGAVKASYRRAIRSAGRAASEPGAAGNNAI